MFKKKNKSVDKNEKTQAGKTTVKSKKAQTGKTTVKGAKTQTGKASVNRVKTQTVKKPAQGNEKTQDQSDKVLAKLMAIEKETRLKQVRDNVDQLEDEKIAEHIELLLKIMRSEK